MAALLLVLLLGGTILALVAGWVWLVVWIVLIWVVGGVIFLRADLDNQAEDSESNQRFRTWF